MGFHVVLIACAIVFAAGLAVYEGIAFRRDGSQGSLTLGLVFLAIGAGLGGYLKGVIRNGVGKGKA